MPFAAGLFRVFRDCRDRDLIILVFILHVPATTKVANSSSFRTWRGVLETTSCDKAYDWLSTSRWFSSVVTCHFFLANWLPLSDISVSLKHLTKLCLKGHIRVTVCHKMRANQSNDVLHGQNESWSIEWCVTPRTVYKCVLGPYS